MSEVVPLGTRLLRFGTSGVAATLIHLAIASLAVYSGLGGTAANVLGFVVANCFSYLSNALWSFRAGVSAQNYGRFLAISLIMLLVTVAISALVEWLGFPPSYSVAAVVVTLPALSFLMHNYWTFR